MRHLDASDGTVYHPQGWAERPRVWRSRSTRSPRVITALREQTSTGLAGLRDAIRDRLEAYKLAVGRFGYSTLANAWR